MRLREKVAIVTGASQGIGAAVAMRYAIEGAKVVINYSRSAAQAHEVADRIRGAGGEATTVQADCSKLFQIETLVGAAIAAYGKVDILVNNAGVFRTYPVEQTTEEIWDEQLDLNLKGAFFLVRALLPEFRKNSSGKVVNIASIWGIGAGPNCPAYCASKGGLVNLTRALAVELGRYRINVNALAPGNTATPINAHLRGPEMEQYKAQMRAMTPTGRDFMDPEELTGTAVFLASADSDSVHGVTIPVDAGWSAW